MSKELVAVYHFWLPDGELARWQSEFKDCDFIDARDAQVAARELPRATITYGLPDIAILPQARSLRRIQLAYAGVPAALCPAASSQSDRETNLAGLYGPTIAGWRLGVVMLFAMGGMAVGGWMGGAIFDATLSYRLAFQVALAFNILNLMLLGVLFFIQRRRLYFQVRP